MRIAARPMSRLWPTLTLLALGITTAGAAPPEPADLVFRNGGIYTVDAKRSWAQAAAIRGGRIVAVGSNDEIAAYQGDKTTVVDLANRLMLPGFHDSHVHVAAAGLEMLQCPLTEMQSVQAILDKVVDCARANPTGWIVGSGWDLSLFENGRPRKSGWTRSCLIGP